jgi:hypothetical protein
MWQTILGIVLAGLLAGLLVRQAIRRARQRKSEPDRLFERARTILDHPSVAAGATAGTYLLTGRFAGHDVQVKAVTDTLALRKLPSLWLMVTLPGAVPVSGTLDLMMRPTGPTSFSNFDHLPTTVATPPDFPEHAVIRTDDPALMPPLELIQPHLSAFRGPRGKELLITPKGLRIVVLLAEADRARYGVLRQADFGDAVVDPELVASCLSELIALRDGIENWHSRTS